VNSHLVIPSIEVLVTPSRDRRDFEKELRSTVHIFWCIDGQDLFVISHLVVPSMEILVTPSRDRRDSEMELRSTVQDFDVLTIQIQSGFHIAISHIAIS
jgi:hypothetical protein